MNKYHAVEECGLARLFLQRHQIYFRCSYQLQSRGMKTVLHYILYMCKQFSNPTVFIKNVNHKLQYVSQHHRRILHDNSFLSMTKVISSCASYI